MRPDDVTTEVGLVCDDFAAQSALNVLRRLMRTVDVRSGTHTVREEGPAKGAIEAFSIRRWEHIVQQGFQGS